MRGLIRIIQFILNHPISSKSKFTSVMRFVAWQIRCMFTNKPYKYKFTANSYLLVSKGMTGATGNIYCGLHEYQEMLFLLHFLHNNDVFVDIGANIGSFTVLASAEKGAITYAFEPNINTYKQLLSNVAINRNNTKVNTYNLALASEKKELKFSNIEDSSMNHVVLDSKEISNIVNGDTLDNVLSNENPVLIKIDVEGYESEVINGADKVLNNLSLKAIIIELNNSGKKYNANDEDIDKKLRGYNFEPYTYDPFNRVLNKTTLHSQQNLIYIRDIDYVRNIVLSANKIKILKLSI